MTNESRKQRELEGLIIAHFDGDLSPQQEKELANALMTSTDAQQLFQSYSRMEGRLHSLGQDGFLREPIEPARAHEKTTTQAPSVTTVGSRHRKRLRLFAASSSIAACATLIILLSASLFWPSSVNANSVLQRAQQAAAEMIDRTYRVTIWDEEDSSKDQELTANVRGGGHFLLRPDDGGYVMGSNGTDYWLAHAGHVWVANDAKSLKPKLRQVLPNTWLFGVVANPDAPLLLDMAGVLAYIERDRAIELIETPNTDEHCVRATLQSTRRKTPANVPETIDLWADASSGVGKRAHVSWADGRQMRFELVESVKLTDQSYHYSEHAPGGAVEQIDSATGK